jgi:hypothetical protein
LKFGPLTPVEASATLPLFEGHRAGDSRAGLGP